MANPGVKLERMGHDRVAYNMDKALEIVERIARGETVVSITAEKGMPSQSAFYRWVTLYPELQKALEAARELSAGSMEEEALGLARAIVLNHGSNTKVRAFDVAMGQLRWSATRRDPARFGEKAQMHVRVPIQIITPLQLTPGKEGDLPAVNQQVNIYSLSADVMPGASEQDAVDASFKDVTPVPSDKGLPREPERVFNETKHNPGWFAKGNRGTTKRKLTPRIGMDEETPKKPSFTRRRRWDAKKEKEDARVQQVSKGETGGLPEADGRQEGGQEGSKEGSKGEPL